MNRTEQAKYKDQITPVELSLIRQALSYMPVPKLSQHCVAECRAERISLDTIRQLPYNGDIVEFRLAKQRGRISLRVLIRAKGRGRVPAAVFSLLDGAIITAFITTTYYKPSAKFKYYDLDIVSLLKRYHPKI